MAEEKIEIEPVLETVLLSCISDAKERLEAGKVLVPFTALAIGNELQMQEHSADEASESFAKARKAVTEADGVDAYAICYDGFVEVEDRLDGKVVQRDCLIAEGGVPGAEYGHTIGLIYRTDDEGNLKFHTEPIYVSRALNYLAAVGIEGMEDLEVFTGAAERQE